MYFKNLIIFTEKYLEGVIINQNVTIEEKYLNILFVIYGLYRWAYGHRVSK